MLFSVNYKSKHQQEAEEIRCPYNQLGQIWSLIKDHPERRYCITIPQDKELNQEKLKEQLDLLKAITSNYTLRTEGIEQLYTFLNDGYNAWLNTPVTNWELFNSLQSLGVTDIYIDGPLAFQLDKLEQVKQQTEIRISPTFSPNAIQRDVKNFYIRPEDLHYYSFAIVDFRTLDQDREDTLYNIYKRGTFNYDLSYLIPGLPRVNNLLFKDEFAEHRLNCSQRCQIPEKTCHYCETYWSVADKMVKVLSHKRDKEQN